MKKLLPLFLPLVMACDSPDETPPVSHLDTPEQANPAASGGKEQGGLLRAPLKHLAAGDKAPDFRVELLGGRFLRLSSHVKSCGGPTILVFARAHW